MGNINRKEGNISGGKAIVSLIKITVIVFIIGLWLLPEVLYAQNKRSLAASDSLVIDSTKGFYIISDVIYTGNDQTRNHIIRRELDLSAGDTIYFADSTRIFEQNANRVFNTRLFITTNIYFLPSADTLYKTVAVKVRERWYTIPQIIFELADRNFNEWWYVRDRSLRRVNIGMGLKRYNMRGRNETLTLKVQGGFQNKYDLYYSLPYLSRKQKTSLRFGFSYSTDNNVAYQTVNNRLEYIKTDDNSRERFYGTIEVGRRQGFFSWQSLNLQFHLKSIADTIVKLNSDYLLNGDNVQRFMALSYVWSYDKRNIHYYPTGGYQVKLTANQNGLGIFGDVAISELVLEYLKFFELRKKLSVGAKLKTKISLPRQQPYNLYEGMGYGDSYVRGYDTYVVDGQHYGLFRSEIRQNIFDRVFEDMSLIPLKQFQTLPLAANIKFFTDMGYVYNPLYEQYGNSFANRPLVSVGIGLDVITFYDRVFRFEYAVTQTGQQGFYFNIGSAL